MSLFYVTHEGRKADRIDAPIPLENCLEFPERAMCSMFWYWAPKQSEWSIDKMHAIIKAPDTVILYQSPTTAEEAEMAVQNWKAPPPDPFVYVNDKMPINSEIVHHYFGIDNAKANGLETILLNASDLVVWLIQKSKEELIDADQLAREFPWHLMEWQWPMEKHQWEPLLKVLKKTHEHIIAQKSRFTDQLLALHHALFELRPYLIPDFIPPYGERKTAYFSLLRASSYHDAILMIIMSYKDTNRKGRSYQYHISQLPTMWLYKMLHPGCCIGLERLSILLHSVTSWAAVRRMSEPMYPIREIVIVKPFPVMQNILRQASAEYGFQLRENVGYAKEWIITVTEDYLQIWHRKWAVIQGQLCGVCLSYTALWQCGASKCVTSPAYCGSECQRHDWMRHRQIGGCIGTLFIPRSLGFEFIEKRDDGRIYGLKEGFWYRYHPVRGEASQMSSWERFERDHAIK